MPSAQGSPRSAQLPPRGRSVPTVLPSAQDPTPGPACAGPHAAVPTTEVPTVRFWPSGKAVPTGYVCADGQVAYAYRALCGDLGSSGLDFWWTTLMMELDNDIEAWLAEGQIGRAHV